jgi:N-acetylglutamate synthase-like GNAT family acetyltransferase
MSELTTYSWDPARALELTIAFHDINAEWINSMFVLEDTDRKVLENPQSMILDKGGDILFAESADLGILGTCALMPMADGAFELTKMGVLERARGKNVGATLLEAVLARAKALKIETLFLLTNKKCASAVHLYEKFGFVHDDGIMTTYGARYERCDVAMLYQG